MKLSTTAIIMAITFLGQELPEGSDPNAVLDDALGEYNLDRDQFMTEETLFACGYHRGLSSASFDPDVQVPQTDKGIDEALSIALQEGYACGLEARELTKTPPPSLVFAAFKSGELTWGNFAAWAAEQDLTETNRLAQSITVGSGKEAVVVPAGTPVDIIAEDLEKDGVTHVIVSYDGLPLLVPNADDAPSIVSGDTEIAPERKRRKSGGAKKAGGSGAKRDRGPTLRDAIIAVIESDPGPLQGDGAFAGRVMAKCAELGIREKATKFVAKAAKHVPYYLNSYKPTKDNHPGRLGVEEPLEHTIAKIEARKYYNKADGTHEEKLKAIPEEFLSRFDDLEARRKTVAPPPVEKKTEKKDDENANA